MPDYHILRATKYRAEKDLADMIRQALATRDRQRARDLTEEAQPLLNRALEVYGKLDSSQPKHAANVVPH